MNYKNFLNFRLYLVLAIWSLTLGSYTKTFAQATGPIFSDVISEDVKNRIITDLTFVQGLQGSAFAQRSILSQTEVARSSLSMK